MCLCSVRIWHGSNGRGEISNNCNDWTTSDRGRGATSSRSNALLSTARASCSEEHYLLCIQVVRQWPQLPNSPSFISNTLSLYIAVFNVNLLYFLFKRIQLYFTLHTKLCQGSMENTKYNIYNWESAVFLSVDKI